MQPMHTRIPLPFPGPSQNLPILPETFPSQKLPFPKPSLPGKLLFPQGPIPKIHFLPFPSPSYCSSSPFPSSFHFITPSFLPHEQSSLPFVQLIFSFFPFLFLSLFYFIIIIYVLVFFVFCFCFCFLQTPEIFPKGLNFPPTV